MSNIYIQEPSSNGKVLLVTTVGDIDVELWSKEAPKACRNFVQLCMEGYYDGTIFHRVVREFIVQGGDPTGTGTGGESIYGGPFKDEFHSRLRFVRRGLIAMANVGPNTNGSQFFFTMGQTPELQNKHTIFGKVAGQTVYNMIKLQDVDVNEEERPVSPHKIIRTEVLSNPFDDIIPRVTKKTDKKDKEDTKKIKSKSKATKNFSLLSFGEEAEEDEELSFKASKKFSGKSKSSHDLSDDPNLSSVPVVDGKATKRNTQNDDEDDGGDIENEKREDDSAAETIRKKLKKEETPTEKKVSAPAIPDSTNNQEEEAYKKAKIARQEARKEARRLQKEIKAAKKKSKEVAEQKISKDETKTADTKPAESGGNDFLKAFEEERKKFLDLKKQLKKKGEGREEQTLALLEKFQSKLASVQNLTNSYSDSEGEQEKKDIDIDDEDDDISNVSWLRHKLKFEEESKKKVLDANVADTDRYEINDPRNPLTQRRREASKKKNKHLKT